MRNICMIKDTMKLKFKLINEYNTFVSLVMWLFAYAIERVAGCG